MKSKLIIALLLLVGVCAKAQDSKKTEEPIAKEGWNFGGIPAVSYDADRGVMYGVITNLYNYGDGSRYPQYDHSLYLELIHYTGGTTNLEFQYDSDRLIPGLYTTANIAYKLEEMYQFYGYNGYNSVYNEDWVDNESDNYISRAFYNYNRKQIRAKFNVQGKLHFDNLRWQAGLGFQSFKVGSVDIDKYNKGKDEEDKIPDVDGLYEKYQQAGVISDEEADGGNIPAINFGLLYDSRDFRTIPQSGIWAVATMEWIPDILGAEGGFSRLGISYSQYVKILDRHRLTFAYRLAWQGTLWGEAPFYYMTQWVNPDTKGATKEGLGGSTSLRGILRNRIIGDGIAYGNFELRMRIVNFRLANQNFFIGSNVFSDLGKVTDNRDFTLESSSGFDQYYMNGQESWHVSYGAGIKLGMNDNFVVSLDYGRATDSQDGNAGFYMEIDYLF